jgi:hypothetical protein
MRLMSRVRAGIDSGVKGPNIREGYRRARRMDKILQQASQKTVKIERKTPRPPLGTQWPLTKRETITEPEPISPQNPHLQQTIHIHRIS